MKIIAHRGYWKKETEKNTTTAFNRAISLGFGIETDVRDVGNNLMIAHDPFSVAEISFLDFYNDVKDLDLTFAINIKADGLSDHISQIIETGRKANFVFFDMSGPEHHKYIERKLSTLNRVSEFERPFAFSDQVDDFWLDSFESENWQKEWLEENVRKARRVFIVSPELHGRNNLSLWRELLTVDFGNTSIFLCTDFPEEASLFFGGMND